MSLREGLDIVRRQWMLVVAGVLLGLLVAGAYTVFTPKEYSSSAVLYVATQNSGDTTQALYQGGLLSEQRVKSYTELIASPRITDAAAAQAGLAGSDVPTVTASSKPDTVLITVAATGSDPQTAATMANAVADVFSRSVATLEQPTDRTRPPAVSIQIFDAAVPATSPSSPRPLLILPLGLLLGLAAGLAAAFTRHALDTRLRTVQEVERFSEATNLGSVAFDPAIAEHPLVVDTSGHTLAAEGFRTVRTNLQFVDVERQDKVVVVTSALPNEGKSTATANLALALRAGGSSVVLVEGDLRRPRAAGFFGLDGSVGLTTVLTGRVTLDEALQPWGGSTMQVLASGVLPPNPSELLGSRNMEQLLAELSRRFSVVLIDAPPLLPVTDAAAVGRFASGAIVVVRHNQTTRHQLEAALGTLEAASVTVLGTIFNASPTSGRYSGAGYSSYYQYGESSALSTADANEFEAAAREETVTIPSQSSGPSPSPTPSPSPSASPSATRSASSPSSESSSPPAADREARGATTR